MRSLKPTRSLCQKQRQLDVFKRSQHRNQVESLKDVADVRIAPNRQLALTHPRQVGPHYLDFAFRDPVDTRQQVQECRFAGAARPHQSEEISLVQFEIDLIQSDNLKPVAIKTLGHIADSYYRFRHGFSSSNY
jgi:hypothetical protein